MHKTARDEIKNIVDSTLRPILKRLGYRKKGNTWNLRDGELIKVVNVQFSSGNTSRQAKFTVNLGVYNPDFRRESLVAGKINEENVKEHECEIRERLGAISYGSDFWWTVYANEDNEKASEDLRTRFTDRGLPWLNSFKNLEDEYNYFAERGIHRSAFVAAYVLQKESLFDHLRENLKGANPFYAKTLEKWMAKRGLTI
ncbi:MAG TPA: DUF4304 domain-containing protein [Pyrinomonadaceae bacterium]|jgi:hypothetical protein